MPREKNDCFGEGTRGASLTAGLEADTITGNEGRAWGLFDDDDDDNKEEEDEEDDNDSGAGDVDPCC